MISQIAPNWLSDKYVDTFQIFTDPEDDVIAFVDDEDGNGKWRIGINSAMFDQSSTKEKYLTIVHELAHIITLNTTQINSSVVAQSCPIGHIDEGCPRSTSYLRKFVKTFWSKSDILESEKETSRLYRQKPENFITEYASTSFVEDAAESFAYFIFGDQVTTGNTIADKKQAFFSQFPELVRTKKEMLDGVKSSIIRAKKLSGALDR
jgi:hypothetical protein